MAPRLPTPKIVMTPPTGAPAGPAHPRRPAAHCSVSIKHSRKVQPRSRSDSSNGSQVLSTTGNDSNASPASLQALGRGSSGESSSNAERWFEKSNNEVPDHGASYADNEPPFFMRNSSSSETPPEAQQQHLGNLTNRGVVNPSLPFRPGDLRPNNDGGSSTEDYRGVIDDLTIANKKLKRRLKQYQKLHDSHLKDEKLFEVRIHGLPPHKKRELEETLRQFASSLEPAGYDGLVPGFSTHKTASSSQTSLQNPADSAYLSMSASGQGSAAHSGNDNRIEHAVASAALQKQSIHSYLHHIPQGLIPHSSPTNMTERNKKKLVVRRLEQLYAGKGAAIGGHQQPQQQQEVSKMAARADRAASEAQGHPQAAKEGARESHIMPEDNIDPVDTTVTSSPDEDLLILQKMSLKRSVAEATKDHHQHPVQRPTRPLDLDPDRAQVPAENFEYIRHLGFSPPQLGAANDQQEGHGWVYLNLLINMAQLHTINVTTDFVRQALSERSSKFEVSKDGRKIRWRGGPTVSRTSSSGGDSPHKENKGRASEVRRSRKRTKLFHDQSGGSSSTNPQGSARTQAENNKLVYTPLFFHRRSTDGTSDDSSSSEDFDSMSSSFPAPAAGDSSGMTSSGMHTVSAKKRKKTNDGPIIFYNNARFCTDLSGDVNANGNANAPPYTTVTAEPIGGPEPFLQARGSVEKRGLLNNMTSLPEAMDLAADSSSLDVSFPPQSPVLSDESSPMKPIDLQVTGIGGVWPTDNIAIAVQTQRARVDQSPGRSQPRGPSHCSLPPQVASVLKTSGLKGRITGSAFYQKVIGIDKRDMPPSALPEALAYMTFDDSNEEDDSEMGDEISISPESPGALPPETAPQPVGISFISSDDDEDDDDDADDDYDEDDESEGSLDMLADARKIDPDAIRAQEREYDAQYAERLAEEIPAGSSAATAGGGSGFASPSSDMSPEEYKKAVKSARDRQAKAIAAAAKTRDT